MEFFETLGRVQDAVTVGRVFGEPIVRGDTTVVPVAVAAGGGGGGGGRNGDEEGGGGGFGVAVRPLGALVIRGDQVSFRPILHPADLLRAAAAFVVALALLRRRGRRRGT